VGSLLAENEGVNLAVEAGPAMLSEVSRGSVAMAPVARLPIDGTRKGCVFDDPGT